MMPIVARVERATREHPDANAVTSPDGHLSYRQLWSQTLALAAHLRESGVRRGDPVALCLPRSSGMVVGALGVLAAGGCYVALDPNYPDDRLAFMLFDSTAQVVVATADVAARIGAPRVIEPMQAPIAEPVSPVMAAAQDPAYIVYTSGSTGQPKGVVIEHAGLLNLIDWHQQAFGITESDRTALISSPRLRRGCLGDLALPNRWRIAAGAAGVRENRSHRAA